MMSTGIGTIYLKDTKTNEIIEVFRTNSINQKSIKLKLRNILSSDSTIKAYCGCCGHEIELKISSNLHIYPAKKNLKHLHHKNCPRSKDERSNYEQSIQHNIESKSIDAFINFAIKPPSKKISTSTASKISSQGKITQARLNTISSLAKHLNVITWDNIWRSYVRGKNEADTLTVSKFMQAIYRNASNFNLNPKNSKPISLGDIFYSNWVISNKIMKTDNRALFVYMQLKSFNLISDNKVAVTLLNSFGQINKFIIDKNLWDESYNQLLCKSSEYIIVCGMACFINKKDYYPTIFNLGMFNINSYGLYSESSYEISFYDLLCSKKILFSKPLLHDDCLEYGDNEFVADGVIDESEYGKRIFIEVFGVNNEDYLKERQAKIDIILSLSETHSLLKWDAFKGDPLPDIDFFLDNLKKH